MNTRIGIIISAILFVIGCITLNYSDLWGCILCLAGVFFILIASMLRKIFKK